MTSGQPDPSSLPRAAKGVIQRRGLMAGVAAATAALLTYAQGRNTEVAQAVDGTFDNINLNAPGKINIGVAGKDGFADIHTVNNLGGLRFYNAATLTTVPDGAALQFWGNGSGLPGRAFIDSGADNNSGISAEAIHQRREILGQVNSKSGEQDTLRWHGKNLGCQVTRPVQSDHRLARARATTDERRAVEVGTNNGALLWMEKDAPQFQWVLQSQL